MIKELYLMIRFIALFVIIVIVAVVFVASRPETLEYVGDTFIKKNGVKYSKLEGSFLDGIIVHDLNYKDAIFAKKLQLKYYLAMLLKPNPKLKEIKTDELIILYDKLDSENTQSNESYNFGFSISNLVMNKTKIIVDAKEIKFDLNASGIKYDSLLDVKNISMNLWTSYASAKMQAYVKSNHLYADANVLADESIRKDYLYVVDTFPKVLPVKLDATLEKISIRSNFDELKLSSDKNLVFNDMNVNLSYFTQKNYFLLDTTYLLSYINYALKIKQKATFTTDGSYSSDINATFTKQEFELLFKNVFAKISGNKDIIKADIDAKPFEVSVLSNDYNKFSIGVKSEELPLAFITTLPEILKKNILKLSADAILSVEPFSFKGEFYSEGLNSKINGDFELDGNKQLYEATLFPKPNSELFKPYPMQLLSPIKLLFKDSKDKSSLNINANLLNLTLFKKDAKITGFGNFGSVTFDAFGDIEDNTNAQVNFAAKIPSLDKFLSEVKAKDKNIFVDAQIDINATVLLSNNSTFYTNIDVPWYIVKTDSTTNYQGQNLHLKSSIIDNEITIDEYNFDVQDHHIYSKKPSKISFDDNATLLFKEFWIYDNLVLSGYINPLKMQGKLKLKSDKFTYDGPEGKISAKADIQAQLKEDGTQNIEGSITLLEGLITYEAQSNYTISDDIIIIQDIKNATLSKRYINIYVTSKKPIKYKSKNIDINFTPEIVLWQEKDKPMALLGMINIENGNVTSNQKVFEFDKSEIYFNGSNPINPYLNLNLHYYTLDYLDLEIFISNTLSSPVVILSSKTGLSQNDIMSYILFGEPASSAFESSDEETTSTIGSLLLATGVKQVFNEATSINIDTLNILTNKEGTLGYEIGTRFNKQIRVIYKSDTVSSVILQYSLSKSIRIDVDVKESAQGVNIIYIKDFKDF